MKQQVAFNSTMESVLELFGASLATGKVVVIGAGPCKPINDAPALTLRLAQNTSLNDASAEFTGLGQRIRTAIQPILVSKAESFGILVDGEIQFGAVLPAKYNIQERHEDFQDYPAQTPRIYGQGDRKGMQILHEGKPTYKHSSLVIGDPDDLILAGDQTTVMSAGAEASVQNIMNELAGAKTGQNIKK